MLDVNDNAQSKLRGFIQKHLEDSLYTCIPAVVENTEKFETHQTIAVSIAINRTLPNRTFVKGAFLGDIPVIFPSAGGGLLSFPIKKGDTVLVCFSKRNIEDWRAGDGSPISPRLQRHFSVADGIAIAGLYTSATNLNPDPDHVVLKFAGSNVTLYNNGDVQVVAAGNLNAVAAGNIALTAVGDVSIDAANVSINSSSLTHNGVSVGDTHVHGGVVSGGSTSGVPQ